MTDRQRFIHLSWLLLECKFLYYESFKYKLKKGVKYPEDDEYDQWENEYKELAKKLNKPASASSMVGFDYNRPSCRLVMSKYIDDKGGKK